MLLGDARERPSHVPKSYACLGVRAAGDVPERLLSGRQGPHPPPPVQVCGPVAGDPIEPSCETRPVLIERPCPSPDVGKGVLDQFFGQVRILKESDACDVHLTRVAIVEFREGAVISFRYSTNQLFVTHTLHYRYERLPPA